MFKEFKNKEKIKVRLRCPKCGSDFRVLVVKFPMINGFPMLGLPASVLPFSSLGFYDVLGFRIGEYMPCMCEVMCHCGFLENKTFTYRQLETIEY